MKFGYFIINSLRNELILIYVLSHSFILVQWIVILIKSRPLGQNKSYSGALLETFAHKRCRSAVNPHFLFLFIKSTSFPNHFNEKKVSGFFSTILNISSTHYSCDDVTGQLVPFSAIPRSWTWKRLILRNLKVHKKLTKIAKTIIFRSGGQENEKIFCGVGGSYLHLNGGSLLFHCL